jgi:hypothetical protein
MNTVIRAVHGVSGACDRRLYEDNLHWTTANIAHPEAVFQGLLSTSLSSSSSSASSSVTAAPRSVAAAAHSVSSVYGAALNQHICESANT